MGGRKKKGTAKREVQLEPSAVGALSVDDLLAGKYTTAAGRGRKRAGTAEGASSIAQAGDAGRPQKRQKKSEAANFQEDLAALQERDPEFYAYLKQTDSDLLDFSLPADDDDDRAMPAASVEEEDEDGEEDVEADDAAEDATTGRGKKALTQQGRQLLNAELLAAWCGEARKHASLRAMRNLLKAFRVACHYGDSEAELEETLGAVSGAVFNRLLVFMLKEASGIFRIMLGVRDDTELVSGAVRKSARWHKVEPLLKSYLGNALHLLGHATSPDMQMYTLRKLRAAIPFLASFQRLQRKYMRAAVRIFGTSGMGPRVQALLFVRHMAASLPPPAIELAIKGVYRAFVRNAKFMTPSSAPHVAFMGNCVVEMFGLDMAAAYEHAFVYIRELASLLRGAVTNKTKDAFREVYCWQTVNTLELWAKLLAAHHDKEELRPLVHPLAQVLVGAVRLLPQPRYFPLHLRLIRALVGLGGATRLLLPASPLLLDLLRWAALHKHVRQGGAAAAGGKKPQAQQQQGAMLLRASKAALATAAFQQDVIQQVMELLASHMAQWACSVAFPELAHVPAIQLRRFVKKTTVARFSAAAKGLLAAMEANAAFVEERRRSVDFAPKDTGLVQAFLSQEDAAQQAPLQAYAKLLHERASQHRALLGAEEVEAGAADDDEEAAGGPEDDGGAEDQVDMLQQMKAANRERRKQQRKNAKVLAPQPTPAVDADGEDEDVLEEYELSD